MKTQLITITILALVLCTNVFSDTSDYRFIRYNSHVESSLSGTDIKAFYEPICKWDISSIA